MQFLAGVFTGIVLVLIAKIKVDVQGTVRTMTVEPTTTASELVNKHVVAVPPPTRIDN